MTQDDSLLSTLRFSPKQMLRIHSCLIFLKGSASLLVLYYATFITSFIIIYIMTENREDQENNYEELSQLRQRIHLSQNRLQELTYHDTHYLDKLISFNSEAKQLINEDLIAEALVYLGEAERVLQYGASCGKTIDRNIIIATLHNEACCYYKEAELSTAAKYIEAVIFNLKSNIASVDSTPSNSSKKSKRTDEFAFAPIEKKVQLVHYHLKFCTISSQAKKRDIALQAGKKVVQIGRSLFTDLRQDNPKLTPCDANNQEMELADLKALLKEVRLFRDDPQVARLEDYLRITRARIRQWNEQKVVRKVSFALQRHVSNYSISEVIDMSPMDYVADDDHHYHNFLTTKLVMRQLLHYAMGYFTISTEYRLMAEELYRSSQEKFTSEEYLRANIYHLMAIVFLAENVSCDLLFMKQIISSYEHHYKQELTAGEGEVQPVEEVAEELLYEAVRQNKSKFNQSLADKISKLKLKDKDREKEKVIKSEYEESYIYEIKAGIKHNQSKAKYKTKSRSNSKKPVKGIASSKKLLNPHSHNETVLQASNMLNSRKERSVSSGKKPVVKKRSVSKDGQGGIKFGKESQKLPPKQEKRQQKRTNDEYQLGNVKVGGGRKRVNSISSASISISCRSRENSLSKPRDKSSKQLSVKKSLKGRGDKKKSSKASKPQLLKHYYL